MLKCGRRGSDLGPQGLRQVAGANSDDARIKSKLQKGLSDPTSARATGAGVFTPLPKLANASKLVT